MAVEVLGVQGSVDGYGDSMEAFRSAHINNSNILLNLLEGKKKNAPRPAYDPAHPDNQWPVMVYHPEKGEKVVGQSLVGLSGKLRDAAEQDNKDVLAATLKAGYRNEPYPKPQIAVLDPATEKKMLQDQLAQQAGQIVAVTDLVQKFLASQQPAEDAPAKGKGK
jgi:hypothetical protein